MRGGSKSGTQDRLETFERALGSLHQLGFTANVVDVDLIVGVIDDLPAFGKTDEVIIYFHMLRLICLCRPSPVPPDQP